ncbi:matrixin family metalloprotease, partial [Candidatus Bathyarchaeota archaeon]|nr:matrixin family metalloprotease [Candidatus Bathyarchaeota archaeon]
MVLAVRQIEAQTEYTIDIRGYTWNHSTISVSIFPRENESWWEPSYLNATLHGIAQWNDAIQEFASNYTDFSYLSSIRFVPTVTNEVASGFDIYVIWIGECGSEATIGQSRATVKSLCVMTNNTVCLAAKAPSGHVMTEVDMQNIVVHELGHTFGLYHCTYSGDVMYSTVHYRETVKPLSSLDLYVLSQIFEWMSNSTQFTSSNTCPQESSVTLPSNISYYHLPIAAENLPLPTPQNLAEYIIGLFLRPELLTAILIAVTLLAVAAIILKRRKKPQ